ncbi:MAG: 16S rRNA processing protein RimM [Saprospiraceae bacterium]|nr:16S rRNA processing protein RimM [Saprospiraceae bacterium]
MERPVYFPIGNLVKPFGHQGHMYATVKDEFGAYVEGLEHIFLQVDGAYIPFFIAEIEGEAAAQLKLEEIDSPQVAAKYSGKTIYVTRDQFPEKTKHRLDKLAELKGFQAFNEDTLLGPVNDVLEFPAQMMLSITTGGKSVLIPLVEAFIVNIDTKNKKIVLKIHEDLLNL